MSDWYDSLEDDSDEKNSLSDSLSEHKTTNTVDVLTGVKKNKSTGVYKNRRVQLKKKNSGSNYQSDVAEDQETSFLPKIETPTKGWSATCNLFIDKKILQEQGLQLNKDGSFTKSPRPAVEELPFIAREYRNLQFQKKKTYKLKKTPRIQKNNVLTPSKNSREKTTATQIKNFKEDIVSNSGSYSFRLGRDLKLNKLLENDNLTDAMKEKLLRSNRSSPREGFQLTGELKKAKRVLNLLETPKIHQSNSQSPKKTLSKQNQSSLCAVNEKKNKIIGEHHSEIVLNGFKTNLSYSERQQIKSGYNPLHLRLGNKKIITDTSRSNYGDSVVENLSEISSRVLSSENVVGEDEESFYRELMKKDKQEKLFQPTSRSDGPDDFSELKNHSDRIFPKEQKEVKHNNLRFKSISKSMSIDLPSEADRTVSGVKKYSHYCSQDNSSKMTKFELALKGRTYGYLANARNIFKMKAQSEGKLNARGGDKNSKVGEKNAATVKKPAESCRQNSLKLLPEVPKTSTNKTSPATENPEKVENSPSGFFLPRVPGAENRDTKLKSEILKQMNECLNLPNGRIENVTHPLPSKAVHYSLKTV